MSRATEVLLQHLQRSVAVIAIVNTICLCSACYWRSAMTSYTAVLVQVRFGLLSYLIAVGK